jgi:hypothetical protein
MEVRTVADNPWIDERRQALGVTVGHVATHEGESPRRLVAGPNAAQYLWTRLRVDFFPDEAESYYHNLAVDPPGDGPERVLTDADMPPL